MSAGLDDRVVIITGAARGLGRAYAERLASAGARVAMVDIAADELRTATEAVTIDAGRVAGHLVDVTDEEQVGGMAADVHRRWGRIDALVNNAGGALFPAGPFDGFQRREWSAVLELNLTAQWLCAAAVAAQMRAAGYGKIVNVSSTTVSKGGPVGLAPYIAAKAGVVGLTRALARELGAEGIRVNAIAPGYIPVDTPKRVHAPEAARALREQVAAEQCLQQIGKPSDLAGTVAFLCSADSDYLTGQVFNVDGGWTHG